MAADGGELLAAEGKPDPRGLILELRRIIYRCELLQEGDFTDGNRQALWCGVVTTYCGLITTSDIQGLGPVHSQTHERLEHECVRHTARSHSSSPMASTTSISRPGRSATRTSIRRPREPSPKP